MKPGPIAIEGTTRVVGIFGDPVDHSLSPRMHNAAFVELGLDYAYVPLRPTAETLREAVAAVRALGLAGVNVTVPFKEAVIPFVDDLTATAKAVGAVNTIYRDGDGALVGENTDVAGCNRALTAHGVRLRGKRTLVIGAGGAARAVVFALLEAGAAEVTIANRTRAKATGLVDAFPDHGARVRAASLEVLEDREFLADRQLVVNSTSVGLKGAKFLAYDVGATGEGCVHFDLAYGDRPTAFIARASGAGRPVVDGRHMLLHQGAAAFKLFTGRRAPLAAMAAAIGISA